MDLLVARLTDPVGVEAEDGSFIPIFAANSPLPCMADMTFSLPTRRNAAPRLPVTGDIIEIRLFQGRDDRARSNDPLAHFRLAGYSPRSPGPPSLLFKVLPSLEVVSMCGGHIIKANDAAQAMVSVQRGGEDSGESRTPSPDRIGAIFVSHAASDGEAALKVVHEIERTGRRCWIAPRDVRAGKDFREEIVRAIRDCVSVVVLISKSANESQHILRELGLAEQYGKPIKPVRLDDSTLAPAFEYQLHALHWVRYDTGMSFVSQLLG